MRTLLSAGPSVIAAGGGAFQNQQTRAFVKQKALSIWLSGAGDIFFQRAQKGRIRPLLKDAGAGGKFMALYRVRMPGYAQADFQVASDGAPVETIIEDIIKVTGIKREKR